MASPPPFRSHFRMRAGEVRALSVRSDARGLIRLAGHLGSLAVTGGSVLALRGSWWIVPALVAHAYVLIFLFCPMHEATHFTPFRTRWLSRALGHFVGFLLVLPFDYFRLFHWDHHRYTHDPARDPELSRPLPSTFAGYLLLVSGLPNWRARLSIVFKHAFTGKVPQPWVPEDKRAGVVAEARIYLLCYALLLGVSIWLQSALLLWLWILPAMIGQPFLRHYLLAEHTGCPHEADALANTRTTYTNAVVRFFAWNMPYHAEHHACPSIPFHSLPAANKHFREHIQMSDEGYVAASRSFVKYLLKAPRRA